MDQQNPIDPDALQDFFASLRKMEEDVTNVWVRQIETGRKHSEESIIELVGRFEAIVRNLESAVDASNANGARNRDGNNALGVLQKGEGKLHAVVHSLEQSMSHKDLLLSEVKNLSTYIRDLQDMAEAVTSLASQTNMLALNAAIEAAHAGERGKGFAVVAAQIRTLSQQSSETGRRIRETIKIISAAISGTFEKAETFSIEDSHRVEAAKHDIGGVLGDFRQLTGFLENSAETLRDSTRGIKNDIAEALVHLQFQDRVSQILCHVRDNIQRLPHYLEQHEQRFNDTGHLAAIDWRELMEELMSTYATTEEFVNHDGHGGKPVKARKAASSDLTFF